MTTPVLTGQQIASAGLEGWTLLLSFGQGGLETRIHTGSFSQGLRIVESIGRAAEDLDRSADLNLRTFQVDVRLSSPEGGVTDSDVTLARRVTDIVTADGAELECRSLARLELGLDTPAYTEIAPFWSAVLESEHVIGTERWGDVGDPRRGLPMIWFQTDDDQSNRRVWHPHLWVDPAQVRPRIDAALAAGGKLVSDRGAPSAWVLSDPDGNELYLCTWQPGDSALCDSQYRPGGPSWTDRD